MQMIKNILLWEKIKLIELVFEKLKKFFSVTLFFSFWQCGDGGCGDGWTVCSQGNQK